MDTPHPNTQALPPGTRLEEFEIKRVLGAGGFGITYLATDTSLGRQVVIKENLPVQFAFRDTHSMTVSPRHTTGEDAENFAWSLENFSKEAALLASLDHPGIVKVLRSFRAFGTAFFVMPYVEGVAFDELIKERMEKKSPFSEAEIRGFLDRVLSALAYLHGRGIYHRDIKPGNILITRDGIPVLIDFGSARQRLNERSMTVVESPGYTPFEQLQSRGNIGPWSDLYALGGTLCKAIVGETPPKANDRAFDDPWNPLMTRDEFSGDFSMVFLEAIDRALKLRPPDRWQDAKEWIDSLRKKPQVSHVSPPIPSSEKDSNIIRRGGEELDFLLSKTSMIRMCWIPPGQFLMGSPEKELGRRHDELRHLVRITRGFWMAKYPVTQEQWFAVMGGNPSYFNVKRCGIATTQHPVDSVNWLDICGGGKINGGFFGEVNSYSPAGWRYDLPTEAEWEYACRAGTTSALHSGENLTANDGKCAKLHEVAWYESNSRGATHPVGQKASNRWGLHDMLGNVWEWCLDWYGEYPRVEATDPKGSTKGTSRVCRGGSWISGAVSCRSAFRDMNHPCIRYDFLGVRLTLIPYGSSD